MTTSYQDGLVTLRLDGAWLAAARFPVVVDPLLGPGQAVTGATRTAVDVVGESDIYHANDAVWVGLLGGRFGERRGSPCAPMERRRHVEQPAGLPPNW